MEGRKNSPQMNTDDILQESDQAHNNHITELKLSES